MKMDRVKNKTGLLLIILITLAAVGGRVIGLSYDNLVSYNHDEQIHLLTAEHFYGGILNPRQIWEGRKFLYSFYPWLSMYIVAGVYHLYDLLRSGYAFLAFWLVYLSGEGGSFIRDLSPPSPGLDGRQALYLGRLTVVLIGSATVPLVYLLGKKLWNRRVGLLAAAILALSGYHIANCHWLKNDVIAVFFLTAAFFFAVRIFLRARASDYIWAAVFSAVAINTKQYNAPILASCLCAHLLTLPRLTLWGLFKRLVEGKFLLFVFVFLVIFGATYPMLYLESDYLVSSFEELAGRTQTEAMFGKTANQASPRSLLQIRRDNIINFARFGWGMVSGFGPYVLLLGLGGIAAAVWSREKRLLLAASFPLFYLPAAVLVASPGIRYQDIIPLGPFFALLAAAFIHTVVSAVFRGRRWLAAATFIGAGLFLLIPYSRMAVGLSYGYWERSTGYFASRWADRHLPPGSSILRESKTVALDPFRYQVKPRVRAIWNRSVNGLAGSGIDYLVTSSRYENRALEKTGLFGPDHPFGRFYLSLPSRYDLIKKFDLGEIPFRGGASKFWQLRREYPLAPGGINSALLRRLQGDLSFSSPELLFAGPGGRCEGTTSFIVPPEAKTGRLIISPEPIPRLGIQVVNGPQPGTVRIRHGAEKLTEEFRAGEVRQFVVPSRSGFPYIYSSYRINVSSPWNSPCLVRLLTDSFRIGIGFFETGDYPGAIPYLEQAVGELPGDWYPRALLSLVYSLTGTAEKAEFYRLEAESVFPGYRSVLNELSAPGLSLDRWAEEFEKWTGFRPQWLAERSGRRWYCDEWREMQGPAGLSRVVIEEIYLPPGEYRIIFRGTAVGEDDELGPLAIQFLRNGSVIRRWEGAGRPEIEFGNRSLSDHYALVVEGESGPLAGLREIVVHPAVESVRFRVSGYLRDLTSQHF